MKYVFALIGRVINAIDWPLMIILMILASVGLLVMHSAVGGTDWRFADQTRNFIVALTAMWIVALTPPHIIMRFAVPFYVVGVLLLLGVFFLGIPVKARRDGLILVLPVFSPQR